MINKTFSIAEKLIDQGLQLSQKLHRQLLDEAETIRHVKKSAALDAITQQKQQIILELNTFTKQLGQVLDTEHLPNNSEGFAAYIIKAKTAGINTQEVSDNWSKLTAVSEKIRLLNEQNGANIEILLRHTRQTLNIIKGKPKTAHSYGPDGSTRTDTHSGTYFSV